MPSAASFDPAHATTETKQLMPSFTPQALHALTSLIAEAQSRLPRVVADARDQQHTWTAIAQQIGVTRLRALARYGGRTAKRRTPLGPD